VTEISSAETVRPAAEPGQLGRPRTDTVPAPIGGWSTAKVIEVSHPTPRSVMLRLDVPDRVDHLPGQHYVIRLTADDGYVAQRSYSIASPPSDPLIELWIERLDDGEVSGFLAEVVEAGDELEVRGPIGGWFVWDGAHRAVGVAGGSGVVPLVAMLRHAAVLGVPDLLTLAVSARTLPDVPYASELVVKDAITYVCGSAGFAEFASSLLVELGCPSADVRVERFGPSG
jgi:ferredoxin-NADP reductase